MANHSATIITPKELAALKRPLPKSWRDAAGMLKGRKIMDPLRYQRQSRHEWEKRLKKQWALSQSK